MDQTNKAEIEADRIRDAITLSKNMRNNGKSLAAIESRLALRGFDARAIQAVMDHIPIEEPKNIIVDRDANRRGNFVLVILAIMVWGLGAFLMFGNRSGLGPTAPFFGFFVMVIGGAIMAAARS